MEADGVKEKQRAELVGQGVGFYVAQPLAVRYNSPVLTGLAPAAPLIQRLVDARVPAGHGHGRGRGGRSPRACGSRRRPHHRWPPASRSR